MAYSYHPLFTAKQVRLIKRRCRKFKVKPDQVDDCFQQLALKVLQSNNARIALVPSAIDNHIKSMLSKEIRYERRLAHLKDEFQEAIVYPLPLQIDTQSLISSMPHFQRRVCCFLAAGFTRTQISQKLKISPRTVGRHIVEIKKQLSNVICEEGQL